MSTRLSTEEIAPRYSLLEGLPAVYAEDDFLLRFVDGLDAILAPVHAAIDDLDAYVDPSLCPPDFLRWLGGWLGLVVNDNWPIQRRRAFVKDAMDVFRWRGTREGIERAVAMYTGATPTIEENGAVSASPEPLGEIPGTRGARLHVIVETDDASVREDLVDRIVADVKPAHVPHSVEIRR